MSTYDQLYDQMTKMAKAAAVSELVDTEGWSWHPTNPDLRAGDFSGFFQIDVTGFMAGPDGYNGAGACYPPGASFDPNGGAGYDLHVSQQKLLTAWEKWNQKIPALFADWVGLPEQTGFDHAVRQVAAAAHKLLLHGSYAPPTGQKTVSIKNGNPVLDNIDIMEAKLASMQGETVSAFQENYMEHLPTVLQGQSGVAMLLALAIATERQILADTRDNVAAIADTALVAFGAAFSGGSSLSLDTVLKLASAALAVAALAPLTGGADVAVAVASTGLGIGMSFMDGSKDADHTEYPVAGGSSPDVVYTNISNVLADLSSKILDLESKMANALTQAEGKIASDHNFSFNLGRLRGPKSDRANLHHLGDVNHVTDGMLAMNFDDAHQIGDRYLPPIALQFNEAAIHADGGFGSGPWQRGPIGLGSQGYYAEYATLLTSFVNVADSTSRQLERAGDLFSLAASAIKNHDTSVNGQMGRIVKQMESDDAIPQRGGHLTLTPGSGLVPTLTPDDPAVTDQDRSDQESRLKNETNHERNADAYK